MLADSGVVERAIDLEDGDLVDHTIHHPIDKIRARVPAHGHGIQPHPRDELVRRIGMP